MVIIKAQIKRIAPMLYIAQYRIGDLYVGYTDVEQVVFNREYHYWMIVGTHSSIFVDDVTLASE